MKNQGVGSTKPFLIGITGGSASGKTLFLKQLLKAFNENQVCLISQDNYYFPRETQPVDENGVSNFDVPESIDFNAFASDIEKLSQGKKVERTEYVFNNPAAVPQNLLLKPAPVVIVEGIFAFYDPRISQLLDLKVFIDAKDHIKLKRRIIRDKDERGYDLDDVLYRYEKHVIPTYERYIEPFRHQSDIVIPNNTHFAKALELLTVFIRSRAGGASYEA